MAKHNELGKEGEDIAVNFLVEKSYVILERNWRSGKKEIDIIAVDNDTIVFIEVKTRKSDDFGSPEDAVDEKRVRHMVAAADTYVNMTNDNRDIRFDVVTIVGNSRPYKIEHIEDAFYAPLW